MQPSSSPPLRSATSAQMFGRYRLCGRLAAGGMAEVWAAQLLAAGGFCKPMVIKRILPELAENPSFLKMLMTEARVAARLSHVNICSVFELGEVDGEFYIAMEYLRGTPVIGLLRTGGAVPPPIAVAIAAAACDGLHYAHEQRDASGSLLGLVHRDVSPHNLFATVDGVVKVLDFGIAKVDDGFSERTEEGKVKGKLTYMSPEQLAALPLDRRSDVWSMGVVIWELLAGRRLFGEGGPAATVDAIRNGRIPSLTTAGLIAPRLDQILAGALCVDRERRYATTAELRRALVEVVTPAGSDQIAHLVWERCAADIAINDRRFEDPAEADDLAPTDPHAIEPGASEILDRLPLRAEETQPSVPSIDRFLSASDPGLFGADAPPPAEPASAVPYTSPEIEIISDSVPDLRPPRRWPAVIGLIALGAAAGTAVAMARGWRPWQAPPAVSANAGSVAAGVRSSATGGSAAPTPEPTAPAAGRATAGPGSGAVPDLSIAIGPAAVEPAGPAGEAADPAAAADPGSASDSSAGDHDGHGAGASAPAPAGSTDDHARPSGPTRTVRERPTRTTRRKVADRPPPVRAEPGKLYLDARPWATIYVDGKKLGVTPILGATVTAGKHTIKAVAEDGRTRSLRIHVESGGEVRRKVTW